MRITDDLSSWQTLNAALRTCTEKYAGELLAAEIKGKRRANHLRRIHSRINKLRAMRERRALDRKAATRNSRLRDRVD